MCNLLHTIPLRGDRFTDDNGRLYEVWKSRFGKLEAHPVINGKPVVNRTTAEYWAVTDIAKALYPEARTDIHPVGELAAV